MLTGTFYGCGCVSGRRGSKHGPGTGILSADLKVLFLLPQDCSVPRQPPAWPEGARWVFLKCINKQEGKPREDKPETLPTWLRGLNATAGFALLRKVPSVP